ncbi:MAG: translocation/assembly module TamB, partial [Akkermansiaceae bacterium]|nr:translocation/assembly module TamB [Akkermansiaceae bacterium]
MDRVSLNNLRASVAGGSLDAGGSLTLTPDFQPGNLDLRLRGRSLPLLRNDMLILRANADLRLAGPWKTATLTGEVAAVDSVFYRDIELLPIGRPFTTPSAAELPRLDPRAVAPGAAASPVPAPFRDWRLGLNVRTQDPFLIRGNLATGRVDVAIRTSGTVADPRLDGTAQLS